MVIYAVKVLFESIHSGNPLPHKIDKNFENNRKKLFEESIILVREINMEKAIVAAAAFAKKAEHEFLNSYGETI